MSPNNEKSLFSKDAWMAFVAHAAVAVVLVGPIAYGMAQTVAADQADKAVESATKEIQPQLSQIREKQARFEADIQHMKQDIEKIDRNIEKLLDLERQGRTNGTP